MDALAIGIEGVVLRRLIPHPDARGSLTEVFRGSWVRDHRPFVQANLSVSRAGALRGLHVHLDQADVWFVLDGSAFVALADLRPGSPTERETATLRLAGDERATLYVPPGVAHGFFAETDVMLLYLVDAEFTGADELGVAWNDPELRIPWPTSVPILSDRDRANPPLANALSAVAPYRGARGSSASVGRARDEGAGA